MSVTAAGIAAGLLLVLTAYLAAVETVLTRLNVVRALRLDEEERRGAAALLWIAEHRGSSMNVLLVLAGVVRLSFATAAVVLGSELLGGWVGVGAGLLAAVVVALTIGEVAPRTAALRHLEEVGLAVAPSARQLVRVAGPVATGIVAVGRGVVPRRDEISGPYASDDELRQVEADAEEQDDELDPEERAMIRSIFELADTIVREIMRPRPDMVTVAGDASLDEVVGTVIEHGYSRLPVHDPEDEDAIVGVVYAKDLLRRVATESGRTRWGDLVRRPTFVPETKRCDDLLRDLREGTVHLAFVVDEYGELVGLVTIEDILEEIVGEIVDEHDREEPLVELLEAGRMRIDARLGVDDLNELLGAELPEDGWDTVGGLVFGTLGRVPVEGETIELDGTVLTVESVQGRRVGKVLVDTADPAGGDPHRAGGDPESETRAPNTSDVLR